MVTARILKILVTSGVALFFTLVAIGNLTDYGSNFAFVQHVLAMDTTFRSPALMWRAIDVSWAHHLAYGLIIEVRQMTPDCHLGVNTKPSGSKEVIVH